MSRMSQKRWRPRAFTLVELLVVFVVLALLMALLLPAIGAAVRKARNASVTAEINTMAQALASFKNKFGDYPPSMIVLVESGNYSSSNLGSLSPLQGRSVSYLRKFWPMVNITTSPAGIPATSIPNGFYDFNGDGKTQGDTPMLLQGHQCLVFFLGGLPQVTQTGLAMTGFSKNPANPFIASTFAMNRNTPFFEFNNGQLAIDPNAGGFNSSQFPGYIDKLGAGSDPNQPPFYAYFSAYAGVGYDPDDVNFQGIEQVSGSPICGAFMTPNPLMGTTPITGRPDIVSSPYPNPYCNDDPVPIKAGSSPPVVDTTVPPVGSAARPRAYQNPQSFQIISPGADRLYGIGGTYAPTASNTLPYSNSLNMSVTGQDLSGIPDPPRTTENDNLTNFATGTLQ